MSMNVPIDRALAADRRAAPAASRWKRRVLATAVLCLSAGAWAQPQPPQAPLSFNAVYRAALLNDATLSAAGAQVTAVTELVEQAKAQFKPNISYQANFFRNDLDRSTEIAGRDPVKSHELYNSSGQTLQLRQPLYRPALLAGLDVARGQLEDVTQGYSVETQNLSVRAIEGYLELLNTQERQRLIVVQQRFAERSVDAARKRFEGGQGIRTDIDEAQARLDLILAQKVEAEQAVVAARLVLAEITRLDVVEVQQLDPDRIPLEPLAPPDLEAWMESAVSTSPVLASLRARVQVAQATVERVRAGHKPTLDAVAQINRSNSENVTTPSSTYLNKQIGVQLLVPLYAGGAIDSQVRQATAELQRAQDLLDAERRALRVRVNREWRGVTDGARRIAALQLAVTSADRVSVSVNRSFEGGVRTVLDVLDAEERAQTARRDLMTARLQYIASRLRLLSQAGQLDAGRIDEADKWFVSKAP
ncbi:MAG: channel protein TolC [Comamonadaceae bacterium]|nr:MAG: channel protein TolC [Comamonadaceae bacterium]